MLTLNQTLNYKCNIQEKRNILFTVKDLSRHKHAIQIDKIQTGDTSNNILIIQVRELQNLIQNKKEKNSPEAKILCRPHMKENLLLQVWEEYLLIFLFVLEISEKGT